MVRNSLKSVKILQRKELIIGSKQEPGFGPVFMLGMGGIYVEVLKDVTFKIAPVTVQEADDIIKSAFSKQSLPTGGDLVIVSNTGKLKLEIRRF